MKTKTIKYVGFYDSKLYYSENRCFCLAATNKMDYIAEALVNEGKKVEIISPSWTENKRGFYSKRTISIADNINFTCCPTFGSKIKMLRIIRVLLSWIWLLFYLIKNIKRDEEIIVYHSMMIMTPIIIAKKIRKFKLVLEVEEIYQDVVEFSKKMKEREYRFFKIADKYIFPTELLNKKLNIENKPYTIIYGAYKVEKSLKVKFVDNKVHVVYAGTLDPRKGGVLAAAVTEYLPENYHVHIIGFGSKQEKKLLLDKIEQISKNTKAKLTYDGLLSGTDYVDFLQKCDIGLCTQNIDAKYNETSFPSKVLSYMANGLRVVSVHIKAIEMSEIGSVIYYYEEQTPKAIAEAIKAVDFNKAYNSIELINKLDREFKINMDKLLER